MSVMTLHGQFEAAADFWKTCRDVMTGEAAMKKGLERYLRRLPGATDEDFSDYAGRALFYNGTARTVTGLLGLVFAKAPAVTLPGDALGAKLQGVVADVDKKVSESAEALSLRQQGKNSILGDVAAAVSAGITAALALAAWWLGSDAGAAGIKFELNTDYDAGRLNGAEVTALVQAWQCGAVSRETLLYQLERGELMRPGATAEDEARKVAADMPPGLVVVGKATVNSYQ